MSDIEPLKPKKTSTSTESKLSKSERMQAHKEKIKAETEWVFKHFTEYFKTLVAKEPDQRDSAYRIRHEVFCEEMHIFERNESHLECDGYDDYAEQVLIQHKLNHYYCGCVRLIMPSQDDQILPIEKQGLDYIDRKDLIPSNFNRSEIAEVSRILIPRKFRRRKIDKVDCAANTGINPEYYNENDIRCFPFLAVGLYMACSAMFKNLNKKHIYFMADPRLGQSMKMLGLTMTQIGPEFEYVGRRIPYYIDFENFLLNLKPSFSFMMEEFSKSMR